MFAQHGASMISFPAHDAGAMQRTIKYIDSVANAAGVEVETINHEELFTTDVDPTVTHKFDRWLAENCFVETVFEEVRSRLDEAVAVIFADGMKSARENLAYPVGQRVDGPKDPCTTDVETIAFYLGFHAVMDSAKEAQRETQEN